MDRPAARRWRRIVRAVGQRRGTRQQRRTTPWTADCRASGVDPCPTAPREPYGVPRLELGRTSAPAEPSVVEPARRLAPAEWWLLPLRLLVLRPRPKEWGSAQKAPCAGRPSPSPSRQ